MPRLDLYIKNNFSSLFGKSNLFTKSEIKELALLPRSFWQKEIILGNIKIKNKIVKPSNNIDIANISSVNIAWKYIKYNWNVFFREHILSYPAPLKILLNKPNFLVVNKPVGLSVHPAFPLSQNLPRKTTLIEALAAYYPETNLVHRLDKETSGVLLVAKNNRTKIFFKKQFKNHQIKKVYYALVEGDFPFINFKISSLVGKQVNNPIKRGASDLLVKIGGNDNPSQQKGDQIINPKNSLTVGEKIASGNLDSLEKLKSPAGKIISYWRKYLKPNKKKYSVLKLTPKTVAVPTSYESILTLLVFLLSAIKFMAAPTPVTYPFIVSTLTRFNGKAKTQNYIR